MAGHPKANINWKEVDRLLQADCEGTEVAAYLGIHPNTLYERCKKEKGCNFSEYLQEKKASGNGLLKVKQFESATIDKNIPMQIWLGKQRLGQKDKSDITTNDKEVNQLPNIIIQTPPLKSENK